MEKATERAVIDMEVDSDEGFTSPYSAAGKPVISSEVADFSRTPPTLSTRAKALRSTCTAIVSTTAKRRVTARRSVIISAINSAT